MQIIPFKIPTEVCSQPRGKWRDLGGKNTAHILGKPDIEGLVSTGFLVIWVGSYFSNFYPAIPTLVSDTNVLGQPNGPSDTDQSWPQVWLRFYWPNSLGHGFWSKVVAFLNLRTKI